MTNCTYCNKNIPEDSIHCPYCGEMLPPEFYQRVEEEIQLALLMHSVCH